MLLSNIKIADWLDGVEGKHDPLIVTPQPLTSEALRSKNGASIDLRLGTWFVSKKARNWSVLDVYDNSGLIASAQSSMSDLHYVPFQSKFILHPRSFILAVTLEWIRVPLQLAGMVTGKSSWGRRGLIVETAPGVHPGFSGCLTLEMTNVGEIPIAIMPGESICQLFLHRLDGSAVEAAEGEYFGQRQPQLGMFKPGGLNGGASRS